MSLPYMPLYIADFEQDTPHLDAMQDGAFNRLLRLQWKTPGCTMPDDLDWIRARVRATGEEWEAAYLPVLGEFFKRRRGRIFSARLKAEFDKANATSKKRSAAGRMGGRPKTPAPEADTSRVKKRSEFEASSFPEKPHGDSKPLKHNGSSQSPDKAGPNHLEPYPEPYSEEKKEAAAAAREGFLDQVRDAASAPENQAWGTDPFLSPVVDRWRGLGLCESEILDVIRATSRGKRIGSPSYFDGAMQEFAGRKSAPPLTPTPPSSGPPRGSGGGGAAPLNGILQRINARR